MFWITLWLVLFAAWMYLIGWLPWKSAREQARLAKAARQPATPSSEMTTTNTANPRGSRVMPASSH